MKKLQALLLLLGIVGCTSTSIDEKYKDEKTREIEEQRYQDYVAKAKIKAIEGQKRRDALPKTTNKETTSTDYSGNAYYPTEDGRDCNKYVASNTNRQFTSDVQYNGNAEGDQDGGYKVVEIDPRYTNRQYSRS